MVKKNWRGFHNLKKKKKKKIVSQNSGVLFSVIKAIANIGLLVYIVPPSAISQYSLVKIKNRFCVLHLTRLSKWMLRKVNQHRCLVKKIIAPMEYLFHLH